jgi:crossover junction endodeoxyribonuclease RusA
MAAASHTLVLPYPPSVNHYWRTFRGRMLISEKGRSYRQAVNTVCSLYRKNVATLRGRLEVTIWVRAPDRRRRDLDNVPKAVLDALQHAGVYADDGQIDRLVVEREGPTHDGSLLVEILERP